MSCSRRGRSAGTQRRRTLRNGVSTLREYNRCKQRTIREGAGEGVAAEVDRLPGRAETELGGDGARQLVVVDEEALERRGRRPGDVPVGAIVETAGELRAVRQRVCKPRDVSGWCSMWSVYQSVEMST